MTPEPHLCAAATAEGLRLEQYAGICAALGLGFPLSHALANDRIEHGKWASRRPGLGSQARRLGLPICAPPGVFCQADGGRELAGAPGEAARRGSGELALVSRGLVRPPHSALDVVQPGAARVGCRSPPTGLDAAHGEAPGALPESTGDRGEATMPTAHHPDPPGVLAPLPLVGPRARSGSAEHANPGRPSRDAGSTRRRPHPFVHAEHARHGSLWRMTHAEARRERRNAQVQPGNGARRPHRVAHPDGGRRRRARGHRGRLSCRCNRYPPSACASRRQSTQVAAATSAAGGTLTPMPCSPVIAAPWSPGAAGVTLTGRRALTVVSTCSCVWSGTIEIKDPACDVHIE